MCPEEESQGLLRLVSYLTVGEQEVPLRLTEWKNSSAPGLQARAWFVPRGSKAHEAVARMDCDWVKFFNDC